MNADSHLSELVVQCDTAGYGIFTARRSHPQFARLAQVVYERDNFTCVFCGFRCMRHQQVVNREKPYTERRVVASDLVTACPLCTDCLFVGGRSESPEAGGRLIACTNIPQIGLNHWVRLLLCIIGSEAYASYQPYARSLYRSLRQRSKPFEKIFGKDTSLPPVFASAFIDSGIQSHRHYHRLMSTVRFLPGRQHYQACIPDWLAVLKVTGDPLLEGAP